MMRSVRSIATGCRPPTPSLERVVEERSAAAASTTITATHRPISSAWTTARSPLSAKNSMKTKITAGDEEQHDPQRRRDHADGAVDAVVPGLLAVGGLVEPLVVGRLLGRASRGSTVWSVRNISTPHGLIASPSVPASIRSHSLADDRPGVADELAGQLVGAGGREELRRLDLLRDDQRLGLGAGCATAS